MALFRCHTPIETNRQEETILHPSMPYSRLPAEQAGVSQAAPMDIIFIDGFLGHTVIGINEDELETPQPVRIDIAAGLLRSLACSTDQIGDTIDYGELRDALHDMLRSHRYQLLEAFAEAVAGLVLNRFGGHWVRVGVTKPGKYHDVDGVGVIIERRRSALDTPSRKRSAEVLQLLGAGLVPQPRQG